MSEVTLQVLQPGMGASLQDFGRPGWRRYGVPLGGAMDEHAAAWANRLVGNPPETPVLELLLQGARLAVVRRALVAVTGAVATADFPSWRAVEVRPGEVLNFACNQSGVWTYLAIAGGMVGERILGSVSAYPRGRLGRTLTTGDLIFCTGGDPARWRGASAPSVPADEVRDYRCPPPIRVWPGPQWGEFEAADREAFFNRHWTVSPRSDRVGYRLEGTPLTSRLPPLLSEPVRLGTFQVPANGLPIVTLKDGPTVGGYAKLGVIERGDLPWVVQSRPGQELRFVMAERAVAEL